jgi:uncharacterized membrane protein YedE/YeeE
VIDLFGEPAIAAMIGLAGGVVLGLAAQVGRFCALGAIEDAIYAADGRRLRSWGIAIGTAIVLVQAAIAAGVVSPLSTLHLGTVWIPWANIAGGLAFGYGMALAGNCGYGALARAGGGDLRSAVIVGVMGVAAYVVLSGPLAPLRVALFPVREAPVPQGLPWLTGVPGVVGIAAGLALLAIAAASRGLWSSPREPLWGAAAGIAVASGWIGTAWLARTGFEATPVLGHSFAAPLGETLLYLMTASGSSISFGVGSVAGVLGGAFLGARGGHRFRWEACDDPRELRRQLAGAALMGTGAVVAMGCTVGQGLSAFALLSYGAPLTVAAIFAGAALGLRQLITGYAPQF